MANKISVLIDVATSQAQKSLKSLKSDVSNADGAFNKLKVAGSGSMDLLKQHAGQLALVGGAALVAFGTKAVMAFQNTAIEAGRLRDALGLSAEEASRLAEVAGDVGIDVGALEKTIGRMNREAENTPSRFDAIGAAIVRNKDGTVNVNETFLATVDALNKMPDATKRAAAAQEIFGRSWMDIAELVGMGADDIRVALGEVSDAKIIDEAEIQKARDTRAALDKLKDSIEDVALELGEELTPAVAAAAETLAGIAPVVAKVAGFVGDAFVEMTDQAYEFGQGVADMVDALPWVDLKDPIAETLYEQKKLERGTADLVAQYAAGKPTMEAFAASLEGQGLSQHAINLAIIEYRKQLDGTNTATGEAVVVTDELTEAIDLEAEATEFVTGVNAKYAEQVKAVKEAEEKATAAREEATRITEENTKALEDQIAATDELFSAKAALVGGDIAVRDAQRGAAEAVAAHNALIDEGTASTDALTASQDLAATGLINAATAARDMAVATAEQNGSTVSAQTANQILIEKLGALASTLAPGSPLRAQIDGYIAELNAIPSEINTSFNISARGATVTPHGDTIGYDGQRASGGPVSAGGTYLVGEQGPELLTMGGNGHVTPNGALKGLGGGLTVNINGGLIDQRTIEQLAREWDRWKRGAS